MATDKPSGINQHKERVRNGPDAPAIGSPSVSGRDLRRLLPAAPAPSERLLSGDCPSQGRPIFSPSD